MSDAISICELGMINDMRSLDVISHNLANTNTSGFKAAQEAGGFGYLLTQAMKDDDSSAMARGVAGSFVQLNQQAGALQETGNPLDIAIEGSGFFELSNGVETRFSRAGAFSMDAQGRLVHDGSWAVVGKEGEILLQGGSVVIQSDGTVTEDGRYAGQLKLVDFLQKNQMQPVGGGLLVAANGDIPMPVDQPKIKQGFLEASNVDAASEMVRMMEVMRHLESSARIMQGYDSMLSTAISTIAQI